MFLNHHFILTLIGSLTYMILVKLIPNKWLIANHTRWDWMDLCIVSIKWSWCCKLFIANQTFFHFFILLVFVRDQMLSKLWHISEMVFVAEFTCDHLNHSFWLRISFIVEEIITFIYSLYCLVGKTWSLIFSDHTFLFKQALIIFDAHLIITWDIHFLLALLRLDAIKVRKSERVLNADMYRTWVIDKLFGGLLLF